MLLAVVQLFYERLRQGQLVHVDAQPRRVRPVRPWRVRLQSYVKLHETEYARACLAGTMLRGFDAGRRTSNVLADAPAAEQYLSMVNVGQEETQQRRGDTHCKRNTRWPTGPALRQHRLAAALTERQD